MTKFNAEREVDIAKAIKYFIDTPGVKKSQAAAKYHIPYRLFKARLNSRPSQNTKGGNNKALNSVQETVLRSYIDWLIYCGHQANLIHIKLGANSILRATGSIHQLDIQWARR